MAAAQAFISDFHAITGPMIGDRRKELLILLNKTKQSLGDSAQSLDLSSLRPQTPLEENFKVESLIYFGKADSLVDILKTENPILIHKVLKARPSLIKRAFENVTGEHLVTVIFPSISLIAKEKLLTRLALHLGDPSRADDYFRSVQKVYGLYLAQRLLSACTDRVIVDCVAQNKVEVTPAQMLTIAKRYPTLTERLFEMLDSHKPKRSVGDKYQTVLRYLAKQDPILCLKLVEKYNPTVLKLRPKEMEAFVSANKEAIVASPHKFLTTFNPKRLGQILGGIGGDVFERFFENVFPRSVFRITTDINVLLQLTDHIKPSSDALNLYLKTFRKVYGAELWTYPELTSPSFIWMMWPEERQAWLKTHTRPKHISEEDWTTYSRPDEAISLLKKKLSLTSNVNVRKKLVNALVFTCKVNRDLDALADVCAYVAEKHRNDHAKVSEEFFKALSSEVLPLNFAKFGDAQWTPLLRCVQIHKANEPGSYYTRVLDERYIQHRLRQGLPVKEQLVQWMRDYKGVFDIGPSDSRHHRLCLEQFGPLIPHDKNTLLCDYLYTITNWNQKHPRARLPLFANAAAVEAVRAELKGDSYAYSCLNVVLHCILNHFDEAEKADYVNLLLRCRQSYDNYYKTPVVHWLMKNKPHLVPEYLDVFLNICPDKRMSLCRYYSHLDVPQKLSAACYDRIEKEPGAKNIEYSVAYLSHAETPAKYLELVAAYYPSELSPDLDSEEGRTTYKLQRALLAHVRNLVPITAAADCVLRFCQGDFLKYSQTALYTLVHSLGEGRTGPVLDVLAKRAVSVRKHAVFLAFQVLQLERAFERLNGFAGTERNASVRKSLFKVVFRSLLANPSERSWNLTKESLGAVDLEDREAFDTLTKHRKVPRAYLAPYVLFAWEALKKLPETNTIAEEAKGRVFEAITPDVISELPDSFYHEIIDGMLVDTLTRPSEFHKMVQAFVCKCIVHNRCERKQNELLDMAFAVLKEFVASNRLGSRSVHGFVEEFCAEFLSKRCLDKKVLERFIGLWLGSVSVYEIFDQYLYMKFTVTYLDAVEGKMTISGVAEEVAKLADALYEENSWVAPVFNESLKPALQYLFALDVEGDCVENRRSFMEAVLKTTRTDGGLLLVVSMLPDKIEDETFLERFNEIIKTVTDKGGTEVRVYLRHYLNLKNSTIV